MELARHVKDPILSREKEQIDGTVDVEMERVAGSDSGAYRKDRGGVFSILWGDEVTAGKDAAQRGKGRCELQCVC